MPGRTLPPMNISFLSLRRLCFVTLALSLFGLGNSLVAADDAHNAPTDVRRASPDAALAALKAGNKRFLSGKIREDYNHLERIKATATHQYPIACTLACSDSRTPPEAIFDLGIGDLFVCRVAGVTAGVNDVASLEYGTLVLGAPLIVVMGHKNCGAMKAAIADKPLPGSLPHLINEIRPAVERARRENPHADAATLLDAATQEQVMGEVRHLLAVSPVLRKLVSEGKLKVVGAIYDISNGRLDWLGEYPEQSTMVAKIAH